jgi:hypothetical protein
MHGDFSRWYGKVPRNQVGILAQEGRILLDADLNAHALLETRWQDLAARAAFGARIAAIPADDLDGWKVTGATISNGAVTLSVMPGAAWADGLLVELEGTAGKPVSVAATPLGPPLQDPPPNLGGAGTRDAVILEVWRRSLNGYQSPGELVEAALGGPDTAERIETAYALRLYRMADADTCRTLDLNDRMSKHGHLTVTIAPTTMTSGDCPVVQGGGYTGLEHDLYRVEIAEVDSGAAMFKWSQWNGGLVGRAEYVASGSTSKLILHAGDQAILRSGLTSCYVEVLVFDQAAGHWRVAYGTSATIDMVAGEIDLAPTAMFGSPPDASAITNPSDPSDKTWFVRVWNDVRATADFPAGGAKELRDGIRLEFGAGSPFVPGDYWTFPVRASMDNPATLLAYAAPFGVHHHRVPLAELHWNGTTAAIDDCRVPLHPLTATDGCCTHSVGDGITSHGDFTRINDAIAALPGTGGRVCVLPGEYHESVVISGRSSIEIVGCGPRSKLFPTDPTGEFQTADPAIHVIDSNDITIEGLQITAGFNGIGILLEQDDQAGTTNVDGGETVPFLVDLRVRDCLINAGGGSGIEVRDGTNVEIQRNRILVIDQANEWAAITAAVQGARIERNYIQVIENQSDTYQALGGIWLRGGCVDVDVFDNEIIGGIAHGVMLGHAEQSASPQGTIFALQIVKGLNAGFIYNKYLPSDCVGCGPGTVGVPPPSTTGPTWVASDGLELIRIRDNSISAMGLSGIGVFGFFPSADQGVIAIEDLEITGNQIFTNLHRQLADVGGDLADLAGYGAISLADVNGLVIRDNEITRNGNDAAGGVCAIFVLSCEAVEIARNRIRGNGPSGPQHVTASMPHGGIWIGAASSPTDEFLFDPPPRGRIAAAIRENEVHSPNGPALSMGALGHVQIVANAFTSEDPQADRFSTVVITHFGLATNLTGSALTLGGLKTGAITGAKMAARMEIAGKPAQPHALTAEQLGTARLIVNVSNLASAAAAFIPPSSLVFANNHCIFEAPDTRNLFGSVEINGLADVHVAGNHFETSVAFASVPVLIYGGTVRVEGNRFTEGNALFSCGALGVYTIATGNIADHCLVVSGSSGVVNTQNLELDSTWCSVFGGFAGFAGFHIGGSP